jgi:hypothetical protein
MHDGLGVIAEQGLFSSKSSSLLERTTEISLTFSMVCRKDRPDFCEIARALAPIHPCHSTSQLLFLNGNIQIHVPDTTSGARNVKMNASPSHFPSSLAGPHSTPPPTSVSETEDKKRYTTCFIPDDLSRVHCGDPDRPEAHSHFLTALFPCLGKRKRRGWGEMGPFLLFGRGSLVHPNNPSTGACKILS